jgi:23S rRNA (uridine2552-2'-O)-methyltransferase
MKSMKQYRDFYFKKAKQENYPARSVYKLQEMDKAHKLLRPGQKVLDLGACPGSWTLYAAERVGPTGRVLGIDLNMPDTVFPPQVVFLQEDIFARSPEFLGHLHLLAPFDVIMSDMAPKTTGSKFTDQARSIQLVEAAFGVAEEWLAAGGVFIAKVFEGPDVQPFVQSLRPCFAKVSMVKPKSSRAESKEIFILGTGFTAAPQAETHR